MAIEMTRPPLITLSCDADGCTESLTDDAFTDWFLRRRAHDLGWQLRPASGKGSRTAPYFCPAHAQGGAR